MGALIGLVLGLGVCLIGWAVVDPTWRPAPRTRGRSERIRELLLAAGVTDVAPWQFVTLCSISAVVGLALGAVISSGVVALAVLAAALAGAAPVLMLRRRAAARRREHAAVWPDAVDHLTSAVRAGLSLPDALIQLGERGPLGLRDPFVGFAADYQSSGRFGQSLDLLKERLADPIGDRVIEALRIAREVGGGDLGRVLRSLSGFLRDDLRTRGEVEARQSWTVTGARLAVAAPWVVLLLMSVQGDVVERFATATGTLILLGGAASCLIAYRLMMLIGRLPDEKRILA